jgi:hypothetical protein
MNHLIFIGQGGFNDIAKLWHFRWEAGSGELASQQVHNSGMSLQEPGESIPK